MSGLIDQSRAPRPAQDYRVLAHNNFSHPRKTRHRVFQETHRLPPRVTALAAPLEDPPDGAELHALERRQQLEPREKCASVRHSRAVDVDAAHAMEALRDRALLRVQRAFGRGAEVEDESYIARVACDAPEGGGEVRGAIGGAAGVVEGDLFQGWGLTHAVEDGDDMYGVCYGNTHDPRVGNQLAEEEGVARRRAGRKMCGRMAVNSELERECLAFWCPKRPKRKQFADCELMVTRVQDWNGPEIEDMERTETEKREEMSRILIGWPVWSRMIQCPDTPCARRKKLRALPMEEFISTSCSRYCRISLDSHLNSVSSDINTTGPTSLQPSQISILRKYKGDFAQLGGLFHQFPDRLQILKQACIRKSSARESFDGRGI
ncbi:hypothetical protein DFH09DRAFT_1274843 [Mycena vulgaris]|nr:hypothetical protein DFH09DRAFT_1274843 [Mycena vulgaris]